MKIRLTPFILTYLFCFTSQAIELTVKVSDPLNTPIQNIVVYLDKLDGTAPKKTQKTIEINQLDKSFAPYLSVMQVGNNVLFNNQDDITHHIYSPVGKNKFEFKISSGKQKIVDSFINEGEVAMGCNIHDWMSGYILVLKTPYFDKTNEQGLSSFTIPDEGNYQLTLWHPQMAEVKHRLTQKISLLNDQKINISLTKAMSSLPEQKNDDDFDFLSDY